jgi:ketosteroid isomerase-like protein
MRRANRRDLVRLGAILLAVAALVKNPATALAFALSVLKSACFGRRVAVSDVETPVARVIKGYKNAVSARDGEAFIRLYDPQVRVFDTWGVWAYDDADKWRGAIESWFGSLGTETVRVAFEDVKSSGLPDFAVVSAVVTYAAISATGAQLRSMDNRLTWVLKMTGNVFRILHEHTSAPVGFEDLKAILHRPTSA